MAGMHRSPVAVIPWPNEKGAKVFCDDGSLWDVEFTDEGATWTGLRSPLPGSTEASHWTPEKPRTGGAAVTAPERTDAQRPPNTERF
jgi:hypothetical protein